MHVGTEPFGPQPGRLGDEGTGAWLVREEGPMLGVLKDGRCRTPLRAAQLRLLLGLFQSDRLTEGCAVALEAGRVTETIAACFRVRTAISLVRGFWLDL